ncbi:unnamed protein product [Candidula unifasciata]|uniref:Fibrinogen C-terminal domain-containing protein n=1 Tax=Candidula unifasciata TaxID=100452 RepID=A0A8S3YP31_9EUPU|nr:unnamed protein product [Candidula unifasciata]
MNFSSEQNHHELILQCQVHGIKSFNYTNPGKLVVSRDSTQTQAYVSVHQSQVGPQSNFSNAQVTGRISFDAGSKRYIRIVWTDLSEDLKGNYTCRVYSVNNELIASKHLTVRLRPIGPDFQAKPHVIQIGLTKRLDVSCALTDYKSLNMSKVGSLDIFKVQNGYECLFARVWTMAGKLFTSGLNELFVTGVIENDYAQCVASWMNPSEDVAGEYLCRVSAVGVKGDPVFFNSKVNVTWELPSEETLLKRFNEMIARQDELVEQEKEGDENLQEAVLILNTTDKRQCRNPTSCDDIYFTLNPGQHLVRVEPEDGLGPINVLCDVVGRREVYTVFQKRFNGKVDFYRNFHDYENGFGSVDSEFWLGLKNIRRLLIQNGDKNQLRVDMSVMGTDLNYTRIYPTFSIGPPEEYRLTVSGLYDRGFGMSSNSHKPFSTYDRGLTHVASRHNRGAGWWFPEDHGYVNLNGVWGVPGKPYSIFWWELRQDLNFILEKTEMKFRRNK